jgi:hypothetical protein
MASGLPNESHRAADYRAFMSIARHVVSFVVLGNRTVAEAFRVTKRTARLGSIRLIVNGVES